MNYKEYVDSYSDFPKEGVRFWDFTPLLKNPAVLRQAVTDIRQYFAEKDVMKIAAIESKGFILGGALAYAFERPLVIIRKPGLTPGSVKKEHFVKEYGQGEYELKEESFQNGEKVLIVYDILAAPGATEAAIKLVEDQGAQVIGCTYIIELEYLNGRTLLQSRDIFSLVKIQEKG